VDVLIADAIEPDVWAWLAARHDVRGDAGLAHRPAEFRRLVVQARTVVVSALLPLEGAVLRSASQLRAIGRLSPALDRIDLPMCAARGIEIVRPSHASTLAEAEFAVGALLQMLRRVPVLSPEGLLVGRELNSCQVGIIGMSGAAKPLADLLKAFGSRVVGYDPGLHASDPQWKRVDIAPTGLRDLFQTCDAVVVLLNYFSRYRGLIGERFLMDAKQDQVLVNLSSSFILDEAALAEALRSGRMAAAWLDSLERTQLAEGSPLAHLDSLQITPRVASTTLESHLRASWDVARRLDEILSEGSRGDDRFKLPMPNPPIAGAGRPAGPAPA
jgi:D-3-phosphoglycerate dehydrogenase / 2-oxoglutarate reductase